MKEIPVHWDWKPQRGENGKDLTWVHASWGEEESKWTTRCAVNTLLSTMLNKSGRLEFTLLISKYSYREHTASLQGSLQSSENLLVLPVGHLASAADVSVL